MKNQDEWDGDAEFRCLMDSAARQILAGEDRPYELGMRLMADLDPLLEPVNFAGTAYCMWGELTDGIDGPTRCARGLSEPQIEDLMRQAAAEWLAVGPTPDEMRRYFDRWRDWPDSLNK